MSDLIYQISSKCWVEEPSDFGFGGFPSTHHRFDRDKFARLIIQECIKITDTHDTSVSNKIASHFKLQNVKEYVS